MAMRRAVVFPGQGTVRGDVSGEVREAVQKVAGGSDIPYQLAVFAGSVSTYRELVKRGYDADVVAGHSLGEYAAAHVAGSLGLVDAARLVAERDRLMGEASRENPGGMIAVIGADAREILDVVQDVGGEHSPCLPGHLRELRAGQICRHGGLRIRPDLGGESL